MTSQSSRRAITHVVEKTGCLCGMSLTACSRQGRLRYLAEETGFRMYLAGMREGLAPTYQLNTLPTQRSKSWDKFKASRAGESAK